MSDWNDSVKPIAKKLLAELLKTHGQQTGAAIEALEIARRRAEIDQTERDWRTRHGFDLESARGNYGSKVYLAGGNLLADGGGMFKSLCQEFGPQRATHVLNGLEREFNRSRWGADLAAWRQRNGFTSAQAAAELSLAVEDVEAIENQTCSAGPEVMRLVRPALRKVRAELTPGV